MIDKGLAEMKLPAQPARLYEPIRYILQIGGKRIRPMLVLLAADIYGEDRVEEALPAALAIELFHNFTLMHDDIMDEAPLRRGMPTVHEKWDTDVAILSGDNLLVLAYQQLANVGPEHIHSLLFVFNRMAQEVCEGQQWDMEFEQLEMITQDSYLDMIRLKTAVLLGSALKIGAIIGGASDRDAKCLYEFGTAIGVAFQLQDDILDLYGDPKRFGKQVGGDILANKKTILLINAYAHADERQKRELLEWQGFDGARSPHRSEQKIQAVKQIYEALRVQEAAAKLKEEYVAHAFSCLDKMSVGPDKLQKLRLLAQSLLTRNS